MTKLEWALMLAERYKLPVFPLRENSKEPLWKNWQDIATTDLSAITAYWGCAPNANIGAAMGFGICAIDLDVKGDKNGIEAWRLLNGGVTPPAVVFRTATGGEHHLFADPDGIVTNTVGYLGEGIDTRGLGGYIVAPGSTIDGAEYTILRAEP